MKTAPGRAFPQGVHGSYSVDGYQTAWLTARAPGPLTFGESPEPIAGFVQPHAQAFGMVVDACRHGNRTLAVQALRLDPLCAHLTGEQVRRLADELLGAHRSYIRCFG